MQYEIIFYAGLAGAVVTLIITIVAFFKCNVIENVQDLLGGKLKKGISKSSSNVENSDYNNKRAKNTKIKNKTSKITKGSNGIDNVIEGKSIELNEKKENISEVIKRDSKKAKGYEDEAAITNVRKESTGSSTNTIDNKPSKMYENKDNNSEITDKKYTINNSGKKDDDATDILNEEDDNDATGLLDHENSDNEATGILDDDEDDATGLLDEEDDEATSLLDDEEDEDDGFNENFVKEIDIAIVNIDIEI